MLSFYIIKLPEMLCCSAEDITDVRKWTNAIKTNAVRFYLIQSPIALGDNLIKQLLKSLIHSYCSFCSGHCHMFPLTAHHSVEKGGDTSLLGCSCNKKEI